MFDHFRFPAPVDIQSKHVGAIGEAIFTASYDPLDPIPYYLREFCRDVVPDWVPADDVRFQARQSDKTYLVDQEKDTDQWKCDARITASYRVRASESPEQYEEVSVEYGTTRWDYTFPVEIKTGGATLDYDNQRRVMEVVAEQDAVQPIYVRLGIEDLPETVTIERFEFIK